jgi:predicted nuclease with TOPRIM domain
VRGFNELNNQLCTAKKETTQLQEANNMRAKEVDQLKNELEKTKELLNLKNQQIDELISQKVAVDATNT